MFARCAYHVVCTTAREIFIVDEDGPVSVTNDAERVTAEVLLAHGDSREIIYRDTQGEWSELMHDGEMFIGFKASDKTPLGVINNPSSYRPPLEKICGCCHQKYVGTSCPMNACNAREPV